MLLVIAVIGNQLEIAVIGNQCIDGKFHLSWEDFLEVRDLKLEGDKVKRLFAEMGMVVRRDPGD